LKILVYATAAEIGGAVTILNQFYREAEMSKNYYFFILGKPLLKDKKNITIYNFGYIKKSWLFRILFYWVKLPKLVKEINPDRIISLNNTIISHTKIHQTIYLHQSLPFYKTKINIFTEPYLWTVKNIVGFLIKFSLKRVDKVIVQSNWLKKRVINELRLDPLSIQVQIPKLNIPNSQVDFILPNIDKDKLNLIFPAGFIKYKNHDMVLTALESLDIEDLKHIDIKFTLSASENKKVNKLYKRVQKHKLPVKFIGYLNINEIYGYYKNHYLLFPSEIETFGLPLLEARAMNTRIICLKTDFALEILNNYNRVDYVNNYKELSYILKKRLS
jgi:hypothetical protein